MTSSKSVSVLASILFLLLSFSAHVLRGQDGRIKVGIVVSPDRSSPTTYLYHYENETVAHSSLKYMEIAKTSFTAGLITQYWINPWVTFRLGIMYADKGYKQRFLTGSNSPSNELKDTRFRLSYLSLPVTVKAPLNDGPAFLYLSSGFATDIYLHGHGGLSFDNQEPFPDVAMSFLLSAGAEFPVSHKFNASFEPTFRMAITDYTMESEYRPFSLGIAFSLLYR